MQNEEQDVIVQEEVVEETTEPVQEETDQTDWKAEALKYKAIAERTKKKVSKTLTTKENDTDLHQDIESLIQAEAKRQFGYKHSLAPEEVDAVYKINPNPTEDTLKDPFVQGGLEKIRSQKRLESNTPSPSGANFTSGGKSWNEMDQAEQERAYPEYLKALNKARQR